MTSPTDADIAAEVAAVLRRIIEATEAGDLDATTPQGRRLLRRIEGAVAAFDRIAEGQADTRA